MGVEVEDILKKIPRPNYAEFPDLYEELDNMTRQIAGLLSPLTEGDWVRFDRASPEDLFTILSKAPDVAVPFFMMLCGFSERELERLYNLKNIYAARREEVLRRFAEVVARHLRHPLHLETALYKFYKNWEEHQKRHRRGRMAERAITEALERASIAAGKVKVKCGGRERNRYCRAAGPQPTQGGHNGAPWGLPGLDKAGEGIQHGDGRTSTVLPRPKVRGRILGAAT